VERSVGVRSNEVEVLRQHSGIVERFRLWVMSVGVMKMVWVAIEVGGLVAWTCGSRDSKYGTADEKVGDIGSSWDWTAGNP